MNQCCEQSQRRSAIRHASDWNGLDYVEVSEDQLTLYAYFLGKLPPELAKPAPDLARYLRLSGGRRVRDIKIINVTPQPSDDPEKDDVLQIQLDRWGDFSTYTLQLVEVKNIDARYSSVDFSFKINCPQDLDCAACPPTEIAPQTPPVLNYMAKDFASFRQLLLDRLALLIPDWQERHVPDIGVTLVELLAYSADQLSYYQDAVATEAYLDTARQRISVRRHARLVDYRMHEGCNARAWLALTTDQDIDLPLTEVAFLTGMNDALAGKPSILRWEDMRDVARSDYEVFEPLLPRDALKLRQAHNAISFYSWGGEFCSISAGSTSASLRDAWTNGAGSRRALSLSVGDVLIFEEVKSSTSGLVEEADRSRRHAVRLTSVVENLDPLLLDAKGDATPVLDIAWADALPFALRLSAPGPAPACELISDITVARANVLLIDAGQSLPPEDIGTVPTLASETECACIGQVGATSYRAGKFRPRLSRAPLCWAEPLPSLASASEVFVRNPRHALPQLSVTDVSDRSTQQEWQVRYDLINSESHELHYLVECDNDGAAYLRFGDGELGEQPAAGAQFRAQYRIGQALAGNVGADAITTMIVPQLLSGVTITLRNPLPATGGIAPEPIAEVKMYAPQAIKQQLQRAIIAQDYQQLAERNPKLQRAAAALVWSGSWNEAEVIVDPRGTEEVDPALLAEIDQYLQTYRRMGHDLRVLPGRYVPLDLALRVCVLPGYQRGHVLAALRKVFSNRRLADGKLGFFHPDNLSFGQDIYLSQLVAIAQAVEGVECVTVTRLQRLFEESNQELEQGLLPLRQWEIAQLDNDPNFPEHGKLAIEIHGGR
ncbi:MAG: putative baseplate assembly protein [Burkholderiales bacterium]|nr:putative baseplate assembly protein [Burkholderiales bacterium]